MVKFSLTSTDKGVSRYELTEEDNVLGFSDVRENEILRFGFVSDETRAIYSEFVLRSTVFLLRDKFDEVRTAFVDPRFARLGFEEDGKGGMRADKLHITFSGCECSAKDEK